MGKRPVIACPCASLCKTGKKYVIKEPPRTKIYRLSVVKESNTNRILKFGKQGERYYLSTCYVDWLYHDSAPNAIQQGLCRRCDPSDCSTKQWSPQRHPEPPWRHEGASGWKCPQILHKSPDQYDGNGMNRFMMFHKSSSPSKSPRQHKKFNKCKDSNQFLLCLKHSGSKYFCTNFSMRGALRGFNSLGFITLKDEITGKSRETWCNNAMQCHPLFPATCHYHISKPDHDMPQKPT